MKAAKNYIFSLLILLLFGVLSFLSLSEHTLQNRFFDGDMLMYHNIYKDVYVYRNSIFEWSISAAPNFLPDMIGLFITNLLTGDFIIAAYLYGLIQFLAFYILLAALYKELKPSAKYDELAVVNYVGMATVILAILFPTPFFELFYYQIGHSFHFGNVILTLVAILIFLKFLRQRKLSLVLLLQGMIFLGVISNRFFLFSFLAPFIASLVWQHWQKRDLTLLKIAAASSITGVASFLSLQVISRLIYIQTNTVGAFPYRLIASLKIFVTDLFSSPVTAIFLIIISINAVIAALNYLAVQRSKNSANDNALRFFSIYYLLLIPSLVTVLFLLGLYKYWGNFRYTFAIYWLGIINIFLFAQRWWQENFKKSWHFNFDILNFILAICILCALTVQYQNIERLLDFKPAETKCLDKIIKKYQLERGIADYWNASSNELFSETKVDIDQYYSNLIIDTWNNTLSDFHRDMDGNPILNEYDFVLTGGLDKEVLQEHFGTPRTILSCENEEVYIYK